MLTYLVRRLAWLAVVLLGVLTISYAMVSAIPGDVAIFYAGDRASPSVIAQTRHALGLDQPKPVQYLHYLQHVAQGDLGRSATMGEPVLRAILDHFPYTAGLAAAVVAVELGMAVALGSLAAARRGGVLDRSLAALSALGVSLPGFWIGIMLLYLVGFRLGWLPLGGTGSPIGLYLILPVLAQGVPWGFWYARILRASLLEALREDYARTARGKGLSGGRIVLRHALPNAILPTLTIAAMDLGQLLGGIVVVETVFAWPGIGLQAYQAVQNLDLPLVIGTVLFAALCICLLNIAVDLLRALLDPRVRLT